MRQTLKIAEWKYGLGSQTWMMFKDDSTGEWLTGQKYDVIIGKTYLVEISEGLNKDDCRLITKFWGVVAGK